MSRNTSPSPIRDVDQHESRAMLSRKRTSTVSPIATVRSPGPLVTCFMTTEYDECVICITQLGFGGYNESVPNRTTCVTSRHNGNAGHMNEERPGVSRHDAVMGGNLLSLAHANAYSELTETVATLVAGEGSTPPLYGGVLRWTVSTLADVVVDKLGSHVRGDRTFELRVRTGSGEQVGPDELPQPESTVVQAVADALAGDYARSRSALDDVVYGMDWTSQMEALVEAVVWLDHLLDTPAVERDDPSPW